MRDLKPAFERAPKDLGELAMLIQPLKHIHVPKLRHLFAVPRSAMRVATEEGEELFAEEQSVDGSKVGEGNGGRVKELTLRMLVNHQHHVEKGEKGEVSYDNNAFC